MITYWHPLCGTPKSYLLTICNVNRLTFHGAKGLVPLLTEETVDRSSVMEETVE
jgi:hypothetical protein